MISTQPSPVTWERDPAQRKGPRRRKKAQLLTARHRELFKQADRVGNRRMTKAVAFAWLPGDGTMDWRGKEFLPLGQAVGVLSRTRRARGERPVHELITFETRIEGGEPVQVEASRYDFGNVPSTKPARLLEAAGQLSASSHPELVQLGQQMDTARQKLLRATNDLPTRLDTPAVYLGFETPLRDLQHTPALRARAARRTGKTVESFARLPLWDRTSALQAAWDAAWLSPSATGLTYWLVPANLIPYGAAAAQGVPYERFHQLMGQPVENPSTSATAVAEVLNPVFRVQAELGVSDRQLVEDPDAADRVIDETLAAMAAEPLLEAEGLFGAQARPDLAWVYTAVMGDGGGDGAPVTDRTGQVVGRLAADPLVGLKVRPYRIMSRPVPLAKVTSPTRQRALFLEALEHLGPLTTDADITSAINNPNRPMLISGLPRIQVTGT